MRSAASVNSPGIGECVVLAVAGGDAVLSTPYEETTSAVSNSAVFNAAENLRAIVRSYLESRRINLVEGMTVPPAERCGRRDLELAAILNLYDSWHFGRLSRGLEESIRNKFWCTNAPERRMATFIVACQLKTLGCYDLFSNASLTTFSNTCLTTLGYRPLDDRDLKECFCDTNDYPRSDTTCLENWPRKAMPENRRVDAVEYARLSNCRPEAKSLFTPFACAHSPRLFGGDPNVASDALRKLFTTDQLQLMRTMEATHVEICSGEFLELAAIFGWYFWLPFGPLSDVLQHSVDRMVEKAFKECTKNNTLANRHHLPEEIADIWSLACKLQRSEADVNKLMEFCQHELRYECSARQALAYSRKSRLAYSDYRKRLTETVDIKQHFLRPEIASTLHTLQSFVQQLCGPTRSLKRIGPAEENEPGLVEKKIPRLAEEVYRKYTPNRRDVLLAKLQEVSLNATMTSPQKTAAVAILWLLAAVDLDGAPLLDDRQVKAMETYWEQLVPKDQTHSRSLLYQDPKHRRRNTSRRSTREQLLTVAGVFESAGVDQKHLAAFIHTYCPWGDFQRAFPGELLNSVLETEALDHVILYVLQATRLYKHQGVVVNDHEYSKEPPRFGDGVSVKEFRVDPTG